MSIFNTILPEFEAYLIQAKDNLAADPRRSAAEQNSRFIPRNFLLEEHLDHARIQTYARYLHDNPSVNFEQWNTEHNEYLNGEIFLTTTPHDYNLIAADDHAICPETFRGGMALIPFQGTDLDTHLIRMVPVSDLAYLSKNKEDHIFSLAEQVLLNPNPRAPAYVELSVILDSAFNGPRTDHRPVFAAFYEEFLEELRATTNDWANQLRDRLGLFHINQWQPGGLPRSVFLFRYPVRELPRHSGKSSSRPLAIPGVLDQKLSEAFCPAPRELDRGRLLNLKADALEEPAREVLHLFMPMKVEHLFRVGKVTNPVPENLMAARRDHLLWMRLHANRDVYASDTDSDLFI